MDVPVALSAGTLPLTPFPVVIQDIEEKAPHIRAGFVDGERTAKAEFIFFS